MNFINKNSSVLVMLGFFTFIASILTLVVLVLEFFISNADGYWHEYNIRVIGFRCIMYASIAVLIYLLIAKSTVIVQNITLSVLSIIFTVFLLEITIPFIFKKSDDKKKVSNVVYTGTNQNLATTLDEHTGIKATPNFTFNWVQSIKNKIVYQAVIHSDSLSRRVTPKPDNTSAVNRHILFFGCSFTYGFAINDTETLPYMFQKLNPRYQSYNYAYNAWGPLQALAKIEHTDLTKEVVQTDGVGIFVFINNHIDRTIPTLEWINFYEGNFPNLDTTTMKTIGLYKYQHPIKYRLSSILWKSNIRNYLNLNLSSDSENCKLVAKTIEAIKKSYLKQFKHDKFYTIIYPGTNHKADLEIIELLKSKGVAVLDYKDIIPKGEKVLFLPYENHPNPTTNQILATQLSKDITQK